MRYCSECGKPITRQWVADDRCERHVCSDCGITHYENPRIIVGAIVCCADKLLMCRRAQAPALGQWTLPSGFLELGETLEQGAARETFEETGAVVCPETLQLLSVVNMTAIEQIAITFRVTLDFVPAISPGPECLEVAFLGEDEIPPEQFAWRASLGDSPVRLFNEIRTGQFSIRLMSLGASDGSGFKAREYGIDSIRDTGAGPRDREAFPPCTRPPTSGRS